MDKKTRDYMVELADALGVLPAFLEKDWYSMRILGSLQHMKHPTLDLVFSGGTSLSKGYGLIQRFSEDLDFKIAMSEDTSRSQRSSFRKDMIAILNQTPEDWRPDLENILVGNGSKFFKIPILYPAQFPHSDALRAHIQLEVTFEQPAISAQLRPLQSFVSQGLGEEAEVERFPCISPIETAANKLSALTWRVLSRDRSRSNDDPTLIRHLHDLAALKETIEGSDIFHRLVLDSLAKDISRANYTESSFSPEKQLQALATKLRSDEIYQQEYQQFVLNMSYAEAPDFADCLDILEDIVSGVSCHIEKQTHSLASSDSPLSKTMQAEAQQFLDRYLEDAIRALIKNMDRLSGELEVDTNGTKSFKAGDFLWSLKQDNSVGLFRVSNGDEITPQTVTGKEMNIIRDFILEVNDKYGLQQKPIQNSDSKKQGEQTRRPKL